MASEIELKLSFPIAALPLIEAHPLLAGAELVGKPKQLLNTYFDTPSLSLTKAGIAIRTRQSGDVWLQTIKCAAVSVGGLSTRPEWEQPYTGEFDFSAVDLPSVRKLLKSEAGQLLPVFTTDFRRLTFQLTPRPGTRILAMLDIGKIVSQQREAPITELELELAQGSPADLLEIAITLAETLPLLPSDLSKAERGYRLFRDEPMRPMKASKTPVSSALTPIQTFRALASEGLRCWQFNLHGALTTDDPEFVHQMRVSLRRLNTLMKVFKPLLPKPFFTEWYQAFKDIARMSGEVRDLDVMRSSVLEGMLREDAAATHQQTVKLAMAACAKARTEANSAFDHLNSGLPLLRFTSALHNLSERTAHGKLVRYAEKRLSKLYRRAIKQLREVIHTPTPETSHHLRIALKHLRYSCEFFAGAFNEKQMQEYARELATLQDELGFINDLHVTLSHLASWGEKDPALPAVRDYIATWHMGRIDQRLQDALASTEAHLAQCMPWCGECDRRQTRGLRKLIRQGIVVDIE